MSDRRKPGALTTGAAAGPVPESGSAQPCPPADLFERLAAFWARQPAGTGRVLAAAVAANLLSFGFIFTNLSLNHDGFGFITIDASWGRTVGRWLTDVVYIHLFHGFELIFLNGILASFLFILAGFTICRTLRVRRIAVQIACVLLFTLFPFLCSVYGYAFHAAIFAAAFFAAMYGVEAAARPGLRSVLSASLLVMASLACYQAYLAPALTLALLAAANDISSARSTSEVRRSAMILGRRIAALLTGALLYLGSVKASVAFFGVELDSYQGAQTMLAWSPASLLHGVFAALSGAWQFLGISIPGVSVAEISPYFSRPLSYLALPLYIGAVAAVWARSEGFARKAAAASLLGLAFLAPRSLQAVHPRANYHELTLFGHAVFLSGAGALALSLAWRRLRSVMQACALLLIAGFIHSNNVGASALVFDYQAVMHWANRILDRVEQHPRYHEIGNRSVRRIVFVGDLYEVSDWFYRGRPFVAATGIADGVPNIVFDKLLNLLRSNVTDQGIRPEAKRQAVLYALSHQPWPHPDSVTILDDGTIVVVLGKPPAAEAEAALAR